MYHTLLVVSPVLQFVFQGGKGGLLPVKPCQSLEWWLHPRLAGWVQPPETELMQVEQPLLVSYGCWPLGGGGGNHKDEVCRVQTTAFTPKEIIQLKHMQLLTSCVPTCQVICHIIQTVAVVQRELAGVNIFCVRDWRERQRKKINVLLHRLWERNCSWAELSANTHCCRWWLTLCGRQTSCKRWHSARRRVSWYLQKHRSTLLVLGTNCENSVFWLCSFSV